MVVLVKPLLEQGWQRWWETGHDRPKVGHEPIVLDTLFVVQPVVELSMEPALLAEAEIIVAHRHLVAADTLGLL